MGGAVEGDGVLHFAGMGLAVLDELIQGVVLGVLLDDQHVGVVTGHGGGHFEVIEEGELVGTHRFLGQHNAGVMEEHGVAVVLGIQHGGGGHHAGTAGGVDHDEVGAEVLGELGAQGAAVGVGVAAGGVGNDDGHGVLGPAGLGLGLRLGLGLGLGLGLAAAGGKNGEDHQEDEDQGDGAFHVFSPL